MSKSLLLDNRGIISWLLSQIALLLAAGILIGAIAGLTFYNDWQKQAEAKAIASHFASFVETMDLKEFPEKMTYLFPEKSYYYKVKISTDYVSVTREDGTIKNKIIGREELLIQPYIRPIERKWSWNDSKELHDFLMDKYGHSGYIDDPIPMDEKSDVLEYLKNELSDKSKELAKEPLIMENPNEPLFIEKAFIYFKKDGGLDREGIVIIHQKEE